MTDTLAARHLERLRRAVESVSCDNERRRAREAVEWLDNMLDILSCCEFCGTPYAIRNPGCPCERCDCGRVVDQVPCDSCRRICNE